MSDMGQKAKLRPLTAMSALLLNADIDSVHSDVRWVPISDIEGLSPSLPPRIAQRAEAGVGLRAVGELSRRIWRARSIVA